MGYTKSFLSGFGWIGFYRLLVKGAVLAKIFFVYRLLDPHDVGLFGIVIIAIGLLEMVFETGINIVLINDDRPLEYFLDTAFVTSLIRGVVIALLLVLCAFFLPSVFGEPDLFGLLLLSGLIPLIRGCINPSSVKFIKQLSYKKESVYRVALSLTESILTVFIVSIMPSAYGLLFPIMLIAVVEVIFSLVVISPRPHLSFRMSVFSHVIRTGRWVNISSIVSYLETNMDNIIVGKLLGVTALGYYQTGFNIARSSITEVGVALSQVSLPLYARLGQNTSRLRRAFLRTLVPSMLLFSFLCVAINSPQFATLLRTIVKQKWEPMFVLLLPLGIHAFLTGIHTIESPVFIVKGALRRYTFVSLMNLFLMIVCVTVGSTLYGFVGAAYGVLIAKLMVTPFFLLQTMKLLRTSES